MSVSESQLPLFVDLDGTLIKSDMTLEALLLLLKKNPFYLLLFPFWLARGRAFFKHQLAQRVAPAQDAVPLNQQFFRFLQEQRSKGRPLTLISGSNQSYVARFKERFDLFDHAEGSDKTTNLRSHAKLARIRELAENEAFAYAGNSRMDLPIWRAADEALMVNCDTALLHKMGSGNSALLFFDPIKPWPLELLRAMRPHQWIKNGLLFLPLLLSHQLDNLTLLLQAGIAFVAFSLCASSVYILNDLLDLESDRINPAKQTRPFAAGSLELSYGMAASPLLLICAFGVASLLSWEFLGVLLLYWCVTLLYTLLLKRLFLVDVLILAGLYTLRIIAGSAAISVVTTNYLIGFSLLLFFSLALVKRVAELVILSGIGKAGAAGRAYGAGHQGALTAMGILASLLAVGVFALYISDPDTTRLYGSPMVLWPICPLLLVLLGRIWMRAYRDAVSDDPVLFFTSDHISQLTLAFCALLVWLAI